MGLVKLNEISYAKCLANTNLTHGNGYCKIISSKVILKSLPGPYRPVLLFVYSLVLVNHLWSQLNISEVKKCAK